MTATFLYYGIHSSKSNSDPGTKPQNIVPESNATNANFTKANSTQLFSSGCNLVAKETADFLTAVLFV